MALTSSSIRKVPRLETEEDLPRVYQWLRDLRSFINSRGSTQEVNTILFREQHKEPRPLETGLLARADGADWDPGGFGQPGVYYYNGTAWVKAF